jgi:cyclic beta-1,2-glucan synthetase
MQAAARVIFTDSGGTLADQIRRHIRGETAVPMLIAPRRFERTLPAPENFRQDNLLFFNGWGGFTQDGREYVIQIKPGKPHTHAVGQCGGQQAIRDRHLAKRRVHLVRKFA